MDEKLAPMPIPKKLAALFDMDPVRSHLPVMEKAIALIAPMLEGFEPKTLKEDKGLLKLLLLRVVLRMHGGTVVRLVHGRVVVVGGIKPIMLFKPLLVAVNTIVW